VIHPQCGQLLWTGAPIAGLKPGGSRRVRWDQVVAIGAPTRRRRGLASTSLELDLDDDGLILFGKTELGADPAEVATELRRLWHPAL